MAVAAKLFVDDLSFQTLLKEFRLLSAEQKQNIKLQSDSFVDWLLDSRVNNFVPEKTQKFRRLLQSVLRKKLEILLTAVGSVKVDEAPSLLREKDFVSAGFLKSLFLAEKGFKLTLKEGEEFVSTCADALIKSESFALGTERKNKEKGGSLMKEKTDSISESVPGDKFFDSDCKRSDAHQLHRMDNQSEDPRAKQLRFLFQCQPDVIAALQPAVSLSDLFKASTFWKSYCTHVQSTFVAWLLDLAEFRYSSLSSTTSFSQYASSLKTIIAQEIERFVSDKPRSVQELLFLVSNGQSGFVDERFILSVIEENSNFCQAHSLSTLSAPLYTSSSKKQHFAKLAADKESDCTGSNTINHNNITVIDPSSHQTWEIRDVFVPKDIRAKILPLLTVNVTWEAILNALKKISLERQKFESEVVSKFDSFLEFLMEFAEKFKPSLNAKKYTDHLSFILSEQVKIRLTSEKSLQLDELFFSLQCAGVCSLDVVHRSLFLIALERLPDGFCQVGDTVCETNVAIVSSLEEDDYLSFDELASLPNLREFLSIEFKFSDFVTSFQRLPENVKLSMNHLSVSFYSLLMDATRFYQYGRSFTEDYLRQTIVLAIEKLFQSLFITSLSLMDIQVKFNCGECSLIHCPDIEDAIKNVEGHHTNLVVEGSWVHHTKNPHLKKSCVMDISHQQSKHILLINSLNSDIQGYIHQLKLALRLYDCSSKRLESIFKLLNMMPQPVKIHVEQLGTSYFHFVLDVLPDKDSFFMVLKEEVCKYVRNLTLYCDDLLHEFFRFVPAFITSREFLDFLHHFRDVFVVVGHHQVGNIVCLVRQPDAQKKIIFFEKAEEDTFALVLKIYQELDSAPRFESFYDMVWTYRGFSPPQRDFIFGVQSSNGPATFHEIHFKRYVLMHPSFFYIRDGRLYIFDKQIGAKSDKPIPHDFTNRPKSISSKCREEGQITSSEDELLRERIEAKQSRKRKQSTDGSPKKKRKKHRKKHPQKAVRPKEAVTREAILQSVMDLVASLPNHLIQDVAVGRLMSSENHLLQIDELIEMLGKSLLRDRKQTVWNSEKVSKAFKKKIFNALKSGNQFQVVSDEKEEALTVRLVLQLSPGPSVTKLPSPSSLVVAYRRLFVLTGVSGRKLSAYVQKVLEINNKPLKISIIFPMAKKQYEHKIPTADTPIDVLYCQVIASMSKDPDIFIDFTKKTCSLKKWLKENTASENWPKEINVSANEIKSFIVNTLQVFSEDNVDNGLTIDEITTKVAEKFKNKVSALSWESLKVIVQALIGDISEIGFTAFGKLFRCTVTISPDSTVEVVDFPSEEDLRMDISEDESVVLPDSTKHDSPTEENGPEKMIEKEEVVDAYIESGVIRCHFDSPENDCVVADSTTIPSTPVEENPTFEQNEMKELNSPPKDPRLKGRAFQSIIQTQNVTSSQTPDSTGNIVSAVGPNVSFTITPSVKKRPHHLDRHKKIVSFAIAFFNDNGHSCETQRFVDQAYREFKEERFARSMLACEAFLRDYIATSDDHNFSFGSRLGDVGASWVFYKPVHSENNFRAKVGAPFVELLPEILDSVYMFVLSTPQKKAPLAAVCEKVADRFSRNFEILDANEVLPVCRNLVLIACIRNLRWFFFGKVEPIVYVRQSTSQPDNSNSSSKEDREHVSVSVSKTAAAGDHSFPSNPASTIDSSAVAMMKRKPPSLSAAKHTVSALKQMANILRQHGPIKKAVLRELWSQRSSAEHRKVFGTGVSFSLSLRKFEKYFPMTSSGKMYVDETAFERFLFQNS